MYVSSVEMRGWKGLCTCIFLQQRMRGLRCRSRGECRLLDAILERWGTRCCRSACGRRSSGGKGFVDGEVQDAGQVKNVRCSGVVQGRSDFGGGTCPGGVGGMVDVDSDKVWRRNNLEHAYKSNRFGRCNQPDYIGCDDNYG